MEVGNKVKLTGITRHGKNRAEGINMRWVSTINDDNFSVEVIDE